MEGSVLRELALKVSEYFKTFIETDFKKAQAPRRRIELHQAKSGFRIGIAIAPYPALSSALWTLLGTATKDPLQLKISPRKYTRAISPTLSEIITAQIDAIDGTQVAAVRTAVIDAATRTVSKAVDDPETWVESIRETLVESTGKDIVRPLIALLDAPLQRQAYSVMDSLRSAEADMIAAASSSLDAMLPNVLAQLHAKADSAPLTDAANHCFTLEQAQAGLKGFFKGFVTSDAFLELRDLETYIATSEEQQLYLYFGALDYRSQRYPMFYVPVEIERAPDGSAYTLTLINHLFANRRAVDYVLEQRASNQQRAWASPVQERINYLAPEQSLFEVAAPLFGRIATAMDLGGQITLSERALRAATTEVALSCDLYIASFDKADEAIVNDYEAIIDMCRRGGSQVVDLFEGLVRGMLLENPVSITQQVEDRWQALPMVDRMVFDSPVPLNEEQRKILHAVRQPEGKIICVSGPPGTGKSHTITAVAADCAFHQRSCLILSDKTEALDVVQSKLSDAMSRVRPDKNFPNPILRLGRENANFRKLTSTQSLTQVTANVRALAANWNAVKEERKSLAAELRAAIAQTLDEQGAVPIAEIKQLQEQEATLAERSRPMLDRLHAVHDAAHLDALANIAEQMPAILTYAEHALAEGRSTADQLALQARRDEVIAKELGPRNFPSAKLRLFETVELPQLREIQEILGQYRELRMPVFGYLFRGSEVRALNTRLNRMAAATPISLKLHAGALQELLDLSQQLRRSLDASKVADQFALAYRAIAIGQSPPGNPAAFTVFLSTFAAIDPQLLTALLAQRHSYKSTWPLVVSFLARWIRLHKAFNTPSYDYVGTKTRLEQLNTQVMNAQVDMRLMRFMENHRTDARALAQVITNRQKFPEDKFKIIADSFPVILASVREFGEYTPLLPEMFDVVVIDEASQVSVAQALPALLRARKVLVLGDARQFSNVKSANASIATNNAYRAGLEAYFKANVTAQADAVQRLAMFDVKRSILEFAELTASYSTMLVKHFRSYPELIGYSSRTFYNGQLQAIRIRGRPIDEVIQFDQVDASGAKVSRGTNEAEAEHILNALLAIVDAPDPPSVGVITPFREQQTLLTRKLFGHTRGRDFEDRLRLKCWTFDSCQGEERSRMFYSLVATPGNDALNYIFPVALSQDDSDVEHKLKVQRLNVGFSRAQDQIVVVHSMPVGDYRGEIGKAMSHFQRVLEADPPTADETDHTSPMEAKLLGWLQQTPFMMVNFEHITVQPQFPIGDYLRQINPTYKHPSYKCDFLLTFSSIKGTVQIIIEYDGFEYHFEKGRQVNVGNHERYLNAGDVERQLTLESYGYKFLRVNRFNLGKDPVETLSNRLADLVESATGDKVATAVKRTQAAAEGISNGQLKPCSRCGQILPQPAFYDEALAGGAGGYGRKCRKCKRLPTLKS